VKSDNEDGKHDGQWETSHVFPDVMWKAKNKGQYNEKASILKIKPYFHFKFFFDDENNYKFNNFCFVNPKIVKWTLCTPPH